MHDYFLRPASPPVPYPPYHDGYYLEEYFYKWWGLNEIKSDRKYLDIFWTNIYLNSGGGLSQLQDYLNTLDSNKKYFTVCQHDDGPLETLPKDTLIFSAGGNRTHGKIIPIPLICSPINAGTVETNKTVFCSFVGSITHPIRLKIYNTYKNDRTFYFKCKKWAFDVSSSEFSSFKAVMAASLFSLCPRGYGATSFRLYEALQLKSIPVYISDYHHLPWSDELDWSKFCILLSPEQIPDLKNILQSYSNDQIAAMIDYGQSIYCQYFTLNGMCNQISKRL